MATMPTFNNLDLMEDVRVKSLKPVINSIKDLMTKSSQTVQLSGTFKGNELHRGDSATQNLNRQVFLRTRVGTAWHQTPCSSGTTRYLQRRRTPYSPMIAQVGSMPLFGKRLPLEFLRSLSLINHDQGFMSLTRL